jgi:hypothetical protein
MQLRRHIEFSVLALLASSCVLPQDGGVATNRLAQISTGGAHEDAPGHTTNAASLSGGSNSGMPSGGQATTTYFSTGGITSSDATGGANSTGGSVNTGGSCPQDAGQGGTSQCCPASAAATGGSLNCPTNMVAVRGSCLAIQIAGKKGKASQPLDLDYTKPIYWWNRYEYRWQGLEVGFNQGDQILALGADTDAIDGDPAIGIYGLAIYDSDAESGLPAVPIVVSDMNRSALNPAQTLVEPFTIDHDGSYWLVMLTGDNGNGSVHLETTNSTDRNWVLLDPAYETTWPQGSSWAATLQRFLALDPTYNTAIPHIYAEFIRPH